jgi:hypothetical protein
MLVHAGLAWRRLRYQHRASFCFAGSNLPPWSAHRSFYFPNRVIPPRRLEQLPDLRREDILAAVVCTENLIRVDAVMESPKLAE